MEDTQTMINTAEAEDTQRDKYLSFRLGKVEYGLEIRYVTEIMGMQKTTDLPDLPEYVKGVINLRGKVIPVIDVRARFGFEQVDYDERTCIIVTNIREVDVGLIVDAVKEVLDIPSTQVDPPPKVRKGGESRFIQGLGKVNEDVKIILDLSKFLFEEEAEQLNAFAEEQN